MPVTFFNTTDCQAIAERSDNITAKVGIQPSIESWEALIIIVGTGAMASLMAWTFSFIRKYIYNDKNSLDTSFDAGGKVNVGLTATTLVSQWTWAATLLQSSTVGSKYGISGPFWYAAGATIQILLFSMLAVQLKIRAPGAKTFLQLIRARFGARCHKIFCVFALVTNIIVTSMLMLGGAAVITSLVKGMSVQYATTLVAFITGAYTMIGGLGATFYVSYFNTAIIYIVTIIFLNKVYSDGDDETNPLGSVEKVYNLVSCSLAPDGNMDASYLTIMSNPGLMFGLINIVGNFGTVFVDQSYWQSAVAAKPKQGVIGFLLGGLSWFAIPFSLATTMGLAYVALSARQGVPLLVDADVDAGLVPPVVAQTLLGKKGELLMLVMILMAITSTGSSEVMAVTSILVFDVYALYLKPYRLTTDTNSCILCGKGRGRMANPRDKCKCQSMTHCAACHQDDKNRTEINRAIKPEYKCAVHGQYRTYLDLLNGLKNWCLVWVSMSIVPLTIVLDIMSLSLGWVYLFMGVLIGSAVIPIGLAMFWDRLTSCAMISGSISGTVLALIVWMSVASTYEDGLSNFLTNTGKELSMLCGNLTAILSGGIITIVLSFVTNRNFSPATGKEIWENTRDIDNPLNPWTETYSKDLNLTGAHQLDNRPSLDEVAKTFKYAKLLAVGGSVTLTMILVVIWPCIMVAVEVMSLSSFKGWVSLSDAWAYLATIAMVSIPLTNEAYDIFKTFRDRNQRVCNDEESLVKDKFDTKGCPEDIIPTKTNGTICVTGIKMDDTAGSNSQVDTEKGATTEAIEQVEEITEAPDEMKLKSGYVIPPPDANESVASDPRAPVFE
ncbi:hypothetical protein SNE40_015215 [Patella caerulea]|uniref:Urea-proton symporter DUR3 n=1 Tax=Patella caerulea TaxID=87958 RepID=A0AAN8JHE5_PATCE